MNINGRLQKAEKQVGIDKAEPAPKTLTMDEARDHLVQLASDIVTDQARLAKFLHQVDRASVTTADIANEYFGGQQAQNDADTVLMWLWFALLIWHEISPYFGFENVTMWAQHGNFYNLTGAAADSYNRRKGAANEQL